MSIRPEQGWSHDSADATQSSVSDAKWLLGTVALAWLLPPMAGLWAY